MSVGSKALRLAILVGVFGLYGACAPRPAGLGQTGTDTIQVLGDPFQQEQAAAPAVVEGSGLEGSGISTVSNTVSANNFDAAPAQQDITAGSAAQGAVTSSNELLAANSSNPVGLRVERGEGFSRCEIKVPSKQPIVDILALKNPSRLVLDLLGEPGKVSREVSVKGDNFVSAIRIGAHKDRTRLVFDLKQDLVEQEGNVQHFVDTGRGTVKITFQDRNTTLASASLPMPLDPGIRSAKPSSESTSEIRGDSPAFEESSGAEVENSAATKDETALAQVPAKLVLDTLKFQKTRSSEGTVVLSLSDSAAFTMQQTAPSEYVLTIPGATASSRTTLPQIAPKTAAGIRSARAVQSSEGVQVRMFVDPGIELQAVPRGNEISVEARPLALARQSGARAQLQTAAGQAPAVEAADTPQAGAAAKKPATEAAGTGTADDSTARVNPTGLRSSDGSKVYRGRLISLDLQDTDIDNALRIIAEVSNLNIIASDDVSGKVTLRLIDVPWDQALDVILKTNGLDQVTEGNVIRIAPVDKLRQEREALSAAKRAAENLEDLTVQYVRVSYAKADELKDQIETVLSERGTVATDDRTNQLILKDIKKGHEQALELIRRLDLRTPQVLLETQIVEGQRNVLRDLGFQWNFQYSQAAATGNATGLNFPNSVVVGGTTTDGVSPYAVNFPSVITDAAGSAVSAVFDSADGSRTLVTRLTALETEGKVKIISRPQVATINNKQAQIKSVETLRIRLPDSGTSIATGSGATSAGGGGSAFEEIDVGIELTVTPQASPDYYVLLDINAKSSTFGSQRVDDIPSTIDRKATSTILVKSGQTFALGGVYRLADSDEVQGVPFMKDIPFLGYFFRRTLADKSDEELIFFITPHIVEGSFDPGSFQAGVL